jgi:hypothetical protein
MKLHPLIIRLTLGLAIIFFVQANLCSKTSRINPGFYLPETVTEVRFTYRTLNNLIILPVVINDSILVNLVLDTGCRNLVLFGKKFQKLFDFDPNRKVQFSGLGSGRSVFGKLSVKNKVAIREVLGEKIPVIVVPERNVFSRGSKIDGVIGYDIFIKFEVELNPSKQEIIFRPASTAKLHSSYQRVPIHVEDSRPILSSTITLSSENPFACSLMIDTGSSLGLLLKTTDLSKFDRRGRIVQLGHGFNGSVNGFMSHTNLLELDGYRIESIPTGIISSPWHNYASIGMDVLKGYSVVLNYCKEYAGFRKLT